MGSDGEHVVWEIFHEEVRTTNPDEQFTHSHWSTMLRESAGILGGRRFLNREVQGDPGSCSTIMAGLSLAIVTILTSSTDSAPLLPHSPTPSLRTRAFSFPPILPTRYAALYHPPRSYPCSVSSSFPYRAVPIFSMRSRLPIFIRDAVELRFSSVHSCPVVFRRPRPLSY